MTTYDPDPGGNVAGKKETMVSAFAVSRLFFNSPGEVVAGSCTTLIEYGDCPGMFLHTPRANVSMADVPEQTIEL